MSRSVCLQRGNGNGYFGLGWSLSIPGVMRKTSKGIPRYRDYDKDAANRDTFVLSGAEDLVPVEAGLMSYMSIAMPGLMDRRFHFFKQPVF